MKRKRGRPPGEGRGAGTPVLVRCQPKLLAALDRWRFKSTPPLPRATAIRRMVELVLGMPEEPEP